MKTINIYTPDELKELRADYGLTQTDLAKIMGLSPTSYMTITKFEKGWGEIPKLQSWVDLNLWLDKKNVENNDVIH